MIVLFPFALLALPVLTMRDQSVAIEGSLRCHLTPLRNVTVELHEKRKGMFKNKVLATNTTDVQGRFYLSGETSRLFPVTPVLHIPKDCKHKEVSIKLNIAKTSVTLGKVPRTVVNVGIINLEILKLPTPSSTNSRQEDNIPYIDVN